MNPRRGHNLILYEQHKTRIDKMVSGVDNKPPPPKPKSQRAEIERRQKEALIELDNRILLDRLAVAMSVKNIDNERKKINFISLMEGKKKRENTRIEKENGLLLHSIQHTVPVYNHLSWERDAEKRLHVLNNMTLFPDLLNERRKEVKQKKAIISQDEKNQQKSLLHKLDNAIIQQLNETGGTSLDSCRTTPNLSPLSSPEKSSRGRSNPVKYGTGEYSPSHMSMPSPGNTSESLPNSPTRFSSHSSYGSLPPVFFVGDSLDGAMDMDYGNPSPNHNPDLNPNPYYNANDTNGMNDEDYVDDDEY